MLEPPPQRLRALLLDAIAVAKNAEQQGYVLRGVQADLRAIVARIAETYPDSPRTASEALQRLACRRRTT